MPDPTDRETLDLPAEERPPDKFFEFNCRVSLDYATEQTYMHMRMQNDETPEQFGRRVGVVVETFARSWTGRR